MDGDKKVLIGFLVCIAVVFVLVIVGCIIGPSWSEIVVTYNCDSPNFETSVIVTMPDGKMKNIYLPVARRMELENGDELCILVKTAAIVGAKTYTVVDNCQ